MIQHKQTLTQNVIVMAANDNMVVLQGEWGSPGLWGR